MMRPFSMTDIDDRVEIGSILDNALVLETKGQDTDQDQVKRKFLAEWVDAVNAHGGFGRWRWDVVLQPGGLKDVLVLHVNAPRTSESYGQMHSRMRSLDSDNLYSCALPER